MKFFKLVCLLKWLPYIKIKGFSFMIKNIHCLKTTSNELGYWWTWTENCDKCGDTIESNNIYHEVPPEEKEIHYCVKCVRNLLNNQTCMSTYNNER